MKLEYLVIIFVIIIVPISLVLGFYIDNQIDILSMQTNYKSNLNDATYDAVKAFQINTTNNYYSSISDSKIRDIEASVNAFYNSLTTSLNYSKSELEAYVPAIVYTLYDGYYIYGKRYNVYDNTILNTDGELTSMDIDTLLEDANKYEYGLKPFVYYSCRYVDSVKNSDFVVNFTLDNFISIYGTVKGEYVTKSGYLINTNSCGGITRADNGQVTDIKTYKGATISDTEKLTEYLKFTDDSKSEGFNDGNYEYVVYQSQKIYKNSTNTVYFSYDQGVAYTKESQKIKNAVDERNKKC